MSQKVLDIGFRTDWPEDLFFLDLAETAQFGPLLDLRNGAYRYIRVEIYDDTLPGAPPLRTWMDQLASESILEPFGVDQALGARAGFLTQGGFMTVYGAAHKPIPLPDLGIVRRYRVEVVGPAWSDILGGDPVPARYHARLQAMSFLRLDRWTVLTGATLIMEYVLALFLIALDLKMLEEDEAYLRGFGQSWRDRPTAEPPGGPNAMTLLGLIALRFKTGNTPQSSTAAVIYDLAKAFIELIVAPDSSLSVFGPDWTIPPQIRNQVEAAARRARDRLLKGVFKHNAAKLVAKANVYVKVASIGVDSGEFYAHYQSLNAVNTVSNALVELRRDRTLLALDPEPRTVASGEPFGLKGARFAWYRLPETASGQTRPELAVADLASGPFSAMVHIEPSDVEAVFVSDIVGADGVPLPLRLYLRPAALSGDRTFPGVDRTGPVELHRRVAFANGLEPLLTAQRPGAGALEIDIENLDHLEMSQSLTASTTRRETRVTVEQRPPKILLPDALELQVGEETHLSFTIELPSRARFRADLPFEARLVEERDQGREIALHGLRLERTHPWTGEASLVELPFTVVLRLRNDDGEGSINVGPGDHAVFVVPASAGYADGFERYELGRYLLGRSFGLSLLEVLLEGLDGEGDHADFTDADRPRLRIGVTPTAVELDVIPLDDPLGQNRLVIEGDQLGEPLIGRVFLQARALDAVLFDSDQDLFVVGEQAPDRITLHEIYTVDGEGAFHRIPFRLRLRVDDTAVARLEIPGFPDSFSGTTRIGGWLRGVGPGETALTADLLPLPPGEADEHAAYALPGPAYLTVETPPPLAVELDSWTDALGATGITDAGPGREVIHAQGALSGRIRNHRPTSAVEVVTLTVNGQALDLLPLLDGQGNFSVDLEVGLGENLLHVVATKPINEILGGPDERQVTLVGAAPRAIGFPAIDLPFDGATGVFFLKEHRTVAFSVRYGRATGAAVVDVMQGGPDDQVASGLALSYDDRTEAGLSFLPDLVPGLHSLTLVAENAFATRSQVLPVRTAPRIVPGAIDVIPLGFFRPGDPFQVGFDTTQVRIEFLTECATRARVHNATAGGAQSVAILGAGFSNAVIETVALEIGDNAIELVAENDFGSHAVTLVVSRRADIWSRQGVVMSVSRYDAPSDARIDVTVYDGAEVVRMSQDVVADTMSLPDMDRQDLQELLTNRLHWWNNGSAFSCIVSVSGTFTGPNFQEASPAFLRITGAVRPDFPHTVVAQPELWSDTAPPGWSDDVWAHYQANFQGRFYATFVSAEGTTGSGDPMPLFAVPTGDPDS